VVGTGAALTSAMPHIVRATRKSARARLATHDKNVLMTKM
jgi:hypothetical protein